MRILLVGLILISLIGCTFENKNESNHLLEIRKNEYVIQYPEELSIDESIEGLEFIIYTEKSHEEDDFIENINLIIQSLDTLDIDLEQFAQISLNQVAEVQGEIISMDLIQDNQEDYYRMISIIPMHEQNLKFLQHFYVYNKNAYVLTFSSELDEFDKYAEEMEEIMSSFRFEKN